MSSPEQLTYYKPVKRIRQACQNCRRKKARCPGQRPNCSFCLRLGQDCAYSDDESSQSPSNRAPSSRVSKAKPRRYNNTVDLVDTRRRAASPKYDDHVSDRLSIVEEQLAEVARTTKGLETTLQTLSSQMSRLVSLGSTTQALFGEDWSMGDGFPRSSEAKFTRLPQLDVIRSAADLYFRYCHNQPYSLFHEATLRQRIELNDVPAHLLFALLASTVKYSSDTYFDDKNVAVMTYAQQSWKSIVMPWNGLQSDAEISIVQTILLLAIIDYTDGRTQAAWIKVGLAIRLNQDCRLMVEPDENLAPAQREERRRVFWSFYLCDKLISCGRERPAAILDFHCRLQLPGDENTWRLGESQKMPTLEQLLSDDSGTALSQLSPFAVTVLVSSLLGRCAQYALGETEEETSAGKLCPWNPRSKYSAIHSAILQHESELGLNEPLSGKIAKHCLATDGSIDQHRAAPLVFAHALFFLCQCLLYHPLLLKQRLARIGQRTPQSFLAQTFHSCHVAANSLSQLMGEVKLIQSEILTTSYDPFYGYSNMVAGVIHAMFLRAQDQHVRETAKASFEASIQNLQALALYWKSCRMMHSRLEDLRESSDRYCSLIDPAAQDVGLSATDVSDLLECLDYARMSTTPRRKSQTLTTPPLSTQVPSPFFEELVNLLPITYSQPVTPGRFGGSSTLSSAAPVFDMTQSRGEYGCI